jgi:Glycosyl transferase family 2
MDNYCILVATYNRAPSLLATIEQLDAEIVKHNLQTQAIIIDDGSSQEHRRMVAEAVSKRPKRAPKLQVVNLDQNHGREGFWRVVQLLFREARRAKAKYYLMLPDDCRLATNILTRSTKQFEFLMRQDKKICCMNLLPLHPTNWGTAEYQDGFFIATRVFFEVFGFCIKPIPSTRFQGKAGYMRSSGVHEQLTKRMGRSQYRIAPASGIAYLDPLVTPSVMFPGKKPDDLDKRKSRLFCNFIDSTETS